MPEIVFKPIGIIHSPFSHPVGMPIQPVAAKGIKGSVEVFREYLSGLDDLDGFSHIILIYHFHLSTGYSLKVKPFLDNREHGVFATRAPKRPNPIGISVVKLLKSDRNMLIIENVDIVDNTPLLDIKPFVPKFNGTGKITLGWLTGSMDQVSNWKSDNRYDSGT